MLQSARACVSSSWQPQLVLYCSGLCHGAMPHCVSHDLFACCEAAPLCPGTAKLSARTQLERDGVHPPDFSGARRRVSSVRRWSLQLSRQRGEPGALHPHLGRQPSYPVPSRVCMFSVCGRLFPLQQQISPYFNPTYTRTGWIGQPPVLDRHEVVTDNGDVDTLRQATP